MIQFNPTGNTVIFHLSNEDLYNILVISIVDWYKSQTQTVQETILTEVCDEDKDRYRFGFNGQEKVNEWAGIGNHLDFTLRGYDSRTGRFNGIDPLSNKYPYWSPFQFAGNSPILFKDLEGAEPDNPVTRWLMTEGMISVVTKPQSAKAKVTGVALGVGGSLSGVVDMVRHPIETAKGLLRVATQTPQENAVDYALGMVEKYGDLPKPVQDYAVGANIGTDFTMMLLPFKKTLSKPSAVTVSMASEAATVAKLPKRLVRVIPDNVKASTLGRTGEADVFVTTPDAIKGLNAEGIAKKLTLKDEKGNYVQGPFKLIEFDAPTEGLAQPINRSNPGFVEGGKTAGGATEYTVPNANISELKNVTETTIK